MKTVKIFDVKFSYIELVKISLGIIIFFYFISWIVTFIGIIAAVTGNNPADWAKFWIRANRLSPPVSIVVFIVVIFTTYKLYKSEQKKDKNVYHKYPLTK